MRKTVLVLLAGVVLLAIASLWMPGREHEPDQPAAPAPLQLPADDKPEPALPPTAPAPTPAPTAPAPTPAPTAPAPAPPAPPAPAAPAPLTAPNPFALQYAAMLEARFQHDQPGPTGQLEADLRTKIGTRMPPASRLEAVECRNQMCRVRSLHPDEATYQQYVSTVFLAPDTKSSVWPGRIWIAVPNPTAQPAGPIPIASSVYLSESELLP